MTYKLYYSLKWYSIPPVIFLLLFFGVLGIFMFFGLLRSIRPKKETEPALNAPRYGKTFLKNTLAGFLSVVFLCVGLYGLLQLINMEEYVRKYRHGEAETVEGVIENLHIAANGIEYYTVNGVEFETQNGTVFGYRKRADSGSVVNREGLPVKISYFELSNGSKVIVELSAVEKEVTELSKNRAAFLQDILKYLLIFGIFLAYLLFRVLPAILNKEKNERTDL